MCVCVHSRGCGETCPHRDEGLTHRDRVEVDESQAGRHHHVGHQREGSQELQVGCEDQQDEDGQEEEHVDAGVEAGRRDLGLVGVVYLATDGGGIGRLHHLKREGRTSAVSEKQLYPHQTSQYTSNHPGRS